MKILISLLLLAGCLHSTGALAFHGIGPVIPQDAILNCEKLGGAMKRVTLDRDTHAMCVVEKEELRKNMVELGLISTRKDADEACDYWQEEGFPNPGRVNCEISFSMLNRRL